MDEMLTQARMERWRRYGKARQRRMLTRTFPEWLPRRTVEEIASTKTKTLAEALGNDVRHSVNSLYPGLDFLFGDIGELREVASKFAWEWSVADMLSDGFVSVVVLDGERVVHETYFRLIRIHLRSKGEKNATEIATKVVDVMNWALRRPPRSLLEMCRDELGEECLRGETEYVLKNTRNAIFALEISQSSLLATIQKSPRDASIVARRLVDGKRLASLKEKLAFLETERDEVKRETEFMLTRCPNDEELSALNAFRKMLWTAPSSADFVTERGFLKRFPCPLCDTPMRFKGHGESVYCPSQQCLAKDFNFYFGQELNLNLTKCVSSCCSQHDLLVVDKAIKCQKPFPSSQQRYLCGECATLPYLTCTVCRKGPIEPRLIDSCTRCQLPVCSRCVAKSLTQSGGRQQQQQQQHSSRRCCAGCFQAHPPPNPPEEDEEGHHVHVHNNATTTTNDVYAVIIPTNSYDDAYYPPVAAHFGALGQADTMMSAWGG